MISIDLVVAGLCSAATTVRLAGDVAVLLPVVTHVDSFVADGAVWCGLSRAVHDLGTCGGVRWKSSNSLISANIIYHAGNASAAVSGRCATEMKSNRCTHDRAYTQGCFNQ